MPRRSTECVCHHPTPAVRRIASSVVKSFKTLSMSAVAKSECGIYAGVYWSSKPRASVASNIFCIKANLGQLYGSTVHLRPSCIVIKRAIQCHSRTLKDPGTNAMAVIKSWDIVRQIILGSWPAVSSHDSFKLKGISADASQNDWLANLGLAQEVWKMFFEYIWPWFIRLRVPRTVREVRVEPLPYLNKEIIN